MEQRIQYAAMRKMGAAMATREAVIMSKLSIALKIRSSIGCGSWGSGIAACVLLYAGGA